MSIDKFRTGQTVEVVLRGEVGEMQSGDSVFTVGGTRHRNCIDPLAEHVVSITVIPDPPAPWQQSDVVRTADGSVFVRRYADHWASGSHGVADDACIDRLIKEGIAIGLIRGGVVQPQPTP